MRQGHSIKPLPGSGGNNIVWVFSSKGCNTAGPESACGCDYYCRVAKVTKGWARGVVPYFCIKKDDGQRGKGVTKLLHTLACTSTPSATQSTLRILPEIEAAVAAGKNVSAADVDDARVEHKCASSGREAESGGRMNRRVANLANSTTGTGAGNLWGKLESYLDEVKAANPGCTTRIEWAEQVDGEPRVAIYVFLQFTSALKCVVGTISLHVCSTPFPPCPPAPDSVNTLTRSFRPSLQIIGVDAAVLKGRSPDDAQVFLLVGVTADNRNIPIAIGKPLSCCLCARCC